MNSFQVSVIIPVYNAVNYVRRAVDSVLQSPEVREVILIDDGYPDGALEICRELEHLHEKVKLFQHPNGANKGAGASRNLGISKATSDFISFLDADDWYLPNRFKETAKLFSLEPTLDGVYAPVGTKLEEGARPSFRNYKTKEAIEQHISFVKKPIDPRDLFSSLIRGKDGSFHTNGIVLKRALINKTGLFNESLRLHQDYELWLRCAYFGKLVGVAASDPVAIRVIHNDNRIHKMDIKTRAKYYEEVCKYFLPRKLRLSDRVFLIREKIFYHPERKHYNDSALRRYPELLKLALKELPSQLFQRS